MSTTAGVFSETLLQNTIAKADELMLDAQIKKQFTPHIEASKAFLAGQTGNMQLLKNQNKDIELTVWWDNVCQNTGRACAPCEVGGEESSTNTKTYKLEECWGYGFSVDENNFTGNYADPATHIAKQKLAKKKAIAEYITQAMVASLNGFAGINQLAGFQGTVSGTDTLINAALWDAKLLAYFNQVITANYFADAAFLTGSNFYQAATIAKASAGNANGAGDANLFSMMNPFFDQLNVDSVNNPDLVTYLIERGSVAFASKAVFDMNSPRDLGMAGGKLIKAWSEENGYIPGLIENWKYAATCLNDRTLHEFSVEVKYGIFQNPTGCNEEITGVLRFVCS